MRSERLQDAIGLVREDYVRDAHAAPAAGARKRRLPLGILAAAVAVLLGSTALAYTAGWFGGLAQLELTETLKITEPESGSAVEVEMSTGMISLQGFVGSAEYQAVQEWNEFLAHYHDDALARIGNGPTGFEDFAGGLYSVYTQAMADEVTRIAEKYGLALHQQMDVVNHQELVRRVGGEFLGEGHARNGGYIYDDGTFHMDGQAIVSGLGQVWYQIYRAAKGSFDTVLLNISDAARYEQWQYTSAGGQTVLLALGPDKGLILGDFDGCFLTVNVLAGSDPASGGLAPANGLTPAKLEELAAGFDFAVLERVLRPEMRGDASTD